MKRIALLSTLMLCAMVVKADTSKNPDRYPSVGIDYTQTVTHLAFPGVERFDPSDSTKTVDHWNLEHKYSQLTLDMRVPITNTFTFSVHGGPNSTSLYGGNETGYSIGAGARLYMPWAQN